jgi:acetate kinase
MPRRVLTLNAGSSSIKFALYSVEDGDERSGGTGLLRGQVEGLGASPRLCAKDVDGGIVADRAFAPADMADHHAAMDAILEALEDRFPGVAVDAVGHRIVHGGARFAEPVVLDAGVIAELEALSSLAPLHQPHNLEGVRAAHRGFPDAVQVGCFDTAFHRRHDWVEDTYALPRAFYDAGVRRYGFHGLSYEYVCEEMARLAPSVAGGRMIVAHLGNGASMCAIQAGRSLASTMGFTALDGLPMGTRCGQLDPGVVLHLLQTRGMTPEELEDLLYHQSGLKGLSGVSQDLRELEASSAPEAAAAIDYFVHRIRRELGALTAVLGGLDGLVFCAGIGEHSARVRAAVCTGLEWLGLSLAPERNAAGAHVISDEGSRIAAFVVNTDEEQMIARHTLRVLVSAPPQAGPAPVLQGAP